MGDLQKYLPLTPLWFQILAVLSEGINHGYGIIKVLGDRLGEFSTATGPVYLALRRMNEEGLIEEAPAPSEGDARRKHYRITRLGRQAARADASRMAELMGLAVEGRLLDPNKLRF